MDFYTQAKELVSKMTLEEKISQLQHEAPAIERLGIPAYNWWNECLHGLARSGVATVFPQAIAMAASFDTGLLEEVAGVISDEIRAKNNEYVRQGKTDIYQGLTMCSPNINIFRDPRWGRGHETYGEDPLLTGKLAVSFVRGLQGTGEFHKADASLKHYAAHSGPEKIRHGFDAQVSEADLYGTYLRAFRYVISHIQPAAVMGAYNAVNGEPCCASPTLLQKILREEFGFQGYVESDAWAISDIAQFHHTAADLAEAAAASLNAGCDLNLGIAYPHLGEAVERGLVTEQAITQAAERLFTARFRLGMFSEDCPYHQIPYEAVDCPAHQQLNRRMAQETVVLLKNDGILPLDPGKRDLKIAVIGPTAADESVLTANYNGTPSRPVSLLRGIQDGTESRVLYARGCHLYRDALSSSDERPLYEAVIAAQKSDVVILCMGLNPSMEGEEGDAGCGNGGDKFDLELPAPQKELYEAVTAVGKPVIFVNVSGSCLNLSRQAQECAALVQCFYPGALGGQALADILFGRVSPSGKLPVSFYIDTEKLPDFADYSMANRTYRFCRDNILYPFGYGLSYTSFTYDALSVQEGSVQVCVKNAGQRAGCEVVQLYGVNSAETRLLDFVRVELAPGEERCLILSLEEDPDRAFPTLYVGNGRDRFVQAER